MSYLERKEQQSWWVYWDCLGFRCLLPEIHPYIGNYITGLYSLLLYCCIVFRSYIIAHFTYNYYKSSHGKYMRIPFAQLSSFSGLISLVMFSLFRTQYSWRSCLGNDDGSMLQLSSRYIFRLLCSDWYLLEHWSRVTRSASV